MVVCRDRAIERIEGSWGLTLVRCLLLLLVGAAIVFNHGCHGDEDTELFSLGWWLLW